MIVKRGEVWLATPDPRGGRTMPRTHPCVIVSPSEIHDYLRTVIVAPMTTAGEAAPFRIALRVGGKRGLILLDQICALDKARLIRRVGTLGPATLRGALAALQQTFAP